MSKIKIKDKEFRLFISEKELLNAIRDVATHINLHLIDEEDPLFVCTLNGSFIFAAELMKQLDEPYEMAFVSYSSYEGTESMGVVKEVMSIKANVKDRMVILIEDIIESGATMNYAIAQFKELGAKEVKLATLLFKPTALKYDLKPDFVGFDILDDFVVGFGLDYDQRGRGLKDIYKIIQNPECGV